VYTCLKLSSFSDYSSVFCSPVLPTTSQFYAYIYFVVKCYQEMKVLIGVKTTKRKGIDRFVYMDDSSSVRVSRVEMCYTNAHAGSYGNDVVDWCCSSHEPWRGK
jgi:hypothetical protein